VPPAGLQVIAALFSPTVTQEKAWRRRLLAERLIGRPFIEEAQKGRKDTWQNLEELLSAGSPNS
jgi:hypothetical protein